jgi:hypothetical protein
LAEEDGVVLEDPLAVVIDERRPAAGAAGAVSGFPATLSVTLPASSAFAFAYLTNGRLFVGLPACTT